MQPVYLLELREVFCGRGTFLREKRSSIAQFVREIVDNTHDVRWVRAASATSRNLVARRC